MLRIKDIGEFGLIEHLAKAIKTDKSVISGIGDDAAVVEWSDNKYLLIASDMLIEGRHFLKKDDPKRVGHKALACSLSDFAAIGGMPKYALISLALSRDMTVEYIDKVYQGIISLAKKFKINIVGGDTNSSNKLTIDITVLGEVKRRKLVLRSGAKKDDLIFVTGGLGGSLKSGHHLEFMPKIEESQYLTSNFNLNSMIDISDGLIADLGHILKKSKVGAIIYEELIPRSKYAQSLRDILYSGEDFELLFTVSLKEARRLKKTGHPKNMQFFMIGEIVNQPGLMLIDKYSKCHQIKLEGFRHF